MNEPRFTSLRSFRSWLLPSLAAAILGGEPATAGVNAWTANGPPQVVNTVVPGGVVGRLYAGTADGLYRSDSGGLSWERLPDSLTGHNILSFAVSRLDPQRLYAGTQLGLQVSADGGTSWSRAEAPGTGILALAVVPAPDEAGEWVYAGTFGRGVYVSRDGGQTWRASPDLVDAIVFALAPAPLAATTLYAGTAQGLSVSRDAGLTWSLLGEALQGLSVRAVHLSAADPNRLSVGTYGDGVLRSDDGGATWFAARTGLQPPQVRALVVDEVNPDVMYAATSTGGFFRTKDGGVNWLPVNFGLTSLSSRALLLDPADRDRLLGTGTGPGVWEIRFAPEPQIQTVPAGLDFGPVPVGSRVARTLQIDNTGTADLVVTEVRLAGSAGFAVDDPGPFVVPAGASHFLTVTFAPTVRDVLLRDELRIASNDPDEFALTLPMAGRGTRSVLSVSPGRIHFGRVPIPPGFADTIVTLTNTGSAPLQLFSAGFDNGRFRVQDFAPATLQPGQSTRVRVSFQPLVPQPQSGNLLLLSDSQPDTLRLPVTGVGAAPDMAVSAVVLDFGRVDLGATRTLPLEVTNTGNADLTISHLAPRGDQFFVDRTLGVPRDTTFTVPAADTILVVSGGDTTLALSTGDSTTVLVAGDTTRLISAQDTTLVVSGGDTTVVVVGQRRTVFAASEDSTLLAPDSTFTFQVTYRPTVSGMVRDTLDLVGDAPFGFGSLNVLLRGEGNALSLDPEPAIAVGVHPVDLVAVDLDGVPGPDLAVVDSVDGGLHVLLNDAGGAFPAAGRRRYPSPASAYGAWVQPVAVAAAPVFGGPLPDLVVGDRVGRSISLLPNDGHGRFDSRRQDIFIGHQLADVVAHDLDTDGDVDVAVANGPGADSITLLYNDGRGGMSARAELPVQAGPVALAAGNLDADGHVDLVVVNREANTVTVLRNDRSGSFLVDAHYPVGDQPVDVALVDVDADGDIDVAVAAAGSRSISLLRNDGAGHLTAMPGPPSTGLRPAALAAAGLTADVLNDLVAVGTGDFAVFFENLDGTTFREPRTVDTGFPVRQVRLADVDGNRVTDLILLSGDSARVQVLTNGLVGRQVPPRPPARVAAVDVPRDLGGKVLLTWEDGDYGRRLPSEQVIATSAYIVTRSTDPDFSVADTLGTVPGGTLTFTDVAATPYQTFYYRVTASRGSLTSAPSAPVSAVSLPAPLVDLKLSNAPRISRGDTLRVQVFLTPAQHRVAGVSVYLTYEPSALRLLPAPADTSRPYRVNSDVASSFTAAVNAFHDGRPETGRLDLALIRANPVGDRVLEPGVVPVLLAEVWFVADRQVATFLAIDDQAAANRSTAVVEDSTGRWIEPVLGDTTRLTVRDLFVSGRVAPQNRAASALAAEMVSLLFVRGGGDTLESALNDADRRRPGIQVPMDSTGGFFLDQIPAGTYQVFAKVSTHLQGVVLGDTVTIDSTRRHLTFRWIAPDTSSTTVLPAGDANDDNRINLADFGLLVRHFGKTAAAADWSTARVADFDGDDEVGLTDFLLLADNFGRVGMAAAPRARPVAAARGRVWLAPDGGLHAEGLGAIRGLTLRLPAHVGVDLRRSLFAPADPVLREWSVGRWHRLALAVPAGVVDGDGVLLRLEGLAAALQAEVLGSVEFLDGQDSVRRPAVGAGGPTSSALHPNFPNPFNPTTQIPFDVGGAAPTPVRLEVFDLLGQRIRVLVDEPALGPGRYRVTWDARDEAGAAVASGLYLARLTTPGTQATRRLLLVR